MDEHTLHRLAVGTELGLAVLTVLVTAFITAPYGRHRREGWGPSLPARWGWVVMESPAVILFAVLFLTGRHALQPAPLVLFGMWQFHYIRRTFVYPFLLRGQRGKTMPVAVVGLALAFNSLNAFVNARWIGHLGHYPTSWLTTPTFWVGAGLFGVGWWINTWADRVLRSLRADGDGGYRIPRGGLYRWVSSPNYLGEILEWVGWAVATWSVAGLAFALYSAANLVPRAASNHAWYHRTFDDYPAERKRLIPHLW